MSPNDASAVIKWFNELLALPEIQALDESHPIWQTLNYLKINLRRWTESGVAPGTMPAAAWDAKLLDEALRGIAGGSEGLFEVAPRGEVDRKLACRLALNAKELRKMFVECGLRDQMLQAQFRKLSPERSRFEAEGK